MAPVVWFGYGLLLKDEFSSSLSTTLINALSAVKERWVTAVLLSMLTVNR